MNKTINLFFAIACSLTLHTAAIAQDDQTADRPASPRWISDKGYWVVESNVKIPKHYIVRFYNNDHVIVYKEEIKGVALKLGKRKVKMQLKKALETSLLAWEKQHEAKENEGWVINATQQH
jgi:hypothetical protein